MLIDWCWEILKSLIGLYNNGEKREQRCRESTRKEAASRKQLLSDIV